MTGNFVIDPDWDESDFERLWGFVEQHDLGRAGFTILTPLPGTAYFEELRPRLRAVQVVAVRHAPRALGAAPRGETVLRAVLRNVAPFDPQSERQQIVARLGAAGARAATCRH